VLSLSPRPSLHVCRQTDLRIQGKQAIVKPVTWNQTTARLLLSRLTEHEASGPPVHESVTPPCFGVQCVRFGGPCRMQPALCTCAPTRPRVVQQKGKRCGWQCKAFACSTRRGEIFPHHWLAGLADVDLTANGQWCALIDVELEPVRAEYFHSGRYRGLEDRPELGRPSSGVKESQRGSFEMLSR
jgi:hypothetical protein